METLVPHYEVILFDFSFGECVFVTVCVCEYITQDDELGLAFDPHSCAGACSYLHAVLHSCLQTADNHWTDGCVHRLIDMKPSFVGQTPDLTKTDTPERIHCYAAQYITKVYQVQGLSLPCTPGWCRSVGLRGEGPMKHWWTCCYGSLLSTLTLAVEAHWVLIGHGGWKYERNKGKTRKNRIKWMK